MLNCKAKTLKSSTHPATATFSSAAFFFNFPALWQNLNYLSEIFELVKNSANRPAEVKGELPSKPKCNQHPIPHNEERG